MASFRFPIRSDIEMLSGVEQVEEFLSRFNRRDFEFRFSGKGCTEGNVCMIELEFDDPEAGDEASLVWTGYWCMSRRGEAT
jgi:hypothetical protein